MGSVAPSSDVKEAPAGMGGGASPSAAWALLALWKEGKSWFHRGGSRVPGKGHPPFVF